MRLSLLTTTAALAVTAPATASHDAKTQQWIVIGTSGQVVDVDPVPFLPESRRLRKLQQREEEEARQKIAEELAHAHRSGHTGGQGFISKAIIEDGFFDDDEDTIATTEANDTEATFDSEPVIPDIDTLIIAGDDSHQSSSQRDLDDVEGEEDGKETGLDIRRGDKAQASKVVHSARPPQEPSSNFMTNLLVALEDDSTFPAVQGSIVFAELSCLFVAFIGYLVHSIPLWATFSFGQKSCLVVAFAAALLYQFVAIGWYYSLISPDVTLGISSLITRTISLGMVPITTTSFMGRARLAAELAAIEEKTPNQVARTKSSRHRKARSS